MQQTLNTIEQQSKKSPPKTPPKPNTQIKQNPNSPPIKRQEQKEVQSLEKINIEVKNFDSQISASEFVETKKQNLSLENLDYVHDSQIYTEVTDTETSFQKENQKWVQQSLKDEQEATTLQRKKPRFNTKDIKKAYITNQILQQRYV
ncbi:MAG: hypothetical protein NZ455_08485 [Bacteroidia bacterium]|nr:hypothetical protein [Bacteroidia bacterium]MDW8345800.1 hypothetical protein [Bacteroidia bacterium]